MSRPNSPPRAMVCSSTCAQSATLDDVMRLIEGRSWNELRTKIYFRPIKSLFNSTKYNSDGLNAFHVACACPDVPPDIVLSIHNVDCRNLTRKSSDDRDVTPLHLACETGSPRTVQLLLTLLDESYEHILDEDSSGRTPLAVTWLRMVKPGYVYYAGDPTTESWDAEDFLQELREYSAHPESERGQLGQLAAATSSSAASSDDVEDTWEKTVYLLLFASRGGMTRHPAAAGVTWNVVHALADGDGRRKWGDPFCPGLILWFALRLFPEQVTWRDPSEGRRLPLHCACAGRPLKPIFEDLDELDVNEAAEAVLRESQRTAIEMLVDAYPRAAKCRDGKGRLPLHLAAETGKGWEGEVRLLIEAAPEAIESRDRKTGLYPFMLAAAGEDTCLDSIFNLLRASPDQVKGGVRSTAYEAYLEMKLTEATGGREAAANELRRKEARIAELEAVVEELSRRETRIVELETQLKKRKREITPEGEDGSGPDGKKANC